MLFDVKLIQAITEADLQTLVSDKVVEQETAEYKQLFSLLLDKDKAEFLRDVSPYANSQGGFLLYGINAGITTYFWVLTNRKSPIMRMLKEAIT